MAVHRLFKVYASENVHKADPGYESDNFGLRRRNYSTVKIDFIGFYCIASGYASFASQVLAPLYLTKTRVVGFVVR